MWKSFLKQNKKHINLNELYLLVFNELENKDKKNEILEHLQNCYEGQIKRLKNREGKEGKYFGFPSLKSYSLLVRN
jgi:hypothetical protein